MGNLSKEDEAEIRQRVRVEEGERARIRASDAAFHTKLTILTFFILILVSVALSHFTVAYFTE